jgi:hypothetical protein
MRALSVRFYITVDAHVLDLWLLVDLSPEELCNAEL